MAPPAPRGGCRHFCVRKMRLLVGPCTPMSAPSTSRLNVGSSSGRRQASHVRVRAWASLSFRRGRRREGGKHCYRPSHSPAQLLHAYIHTHRSEGIQREKPFPPQ